MCDCVYWMFYIPVAVFFSWFSVQSRQLYSNFQLVVCHIHSITFFQLLSLFHFYFFSYFPHHPSPFFYLFPLNFPTFLLPFLSSCCGLFCWARLCQLTSLGMGAPVSLMPRLASLWQIILSSWSHGREWHVFTSVCVNGSVSHRYRRLMYESA